MDSTVNNLQQFVEYTQRLKGDEKGEAQVFCDRLFQAFGHAGYKEAGATLEERVKRKGQHTKFADLVWKPRLLLEMKSRGEKLERHYRQAFEYWLSLVPHRPRHVALCNFDEFWIYDFDLQLDTPVDKLSINELPQRYTALNFLFPVEKKPQFGNDRVAVTRAAADKVARVFNSLIKRKEDRSRAQLFVLQCVMAMFSEDFGLLPRGLFTELIDECVSGASPYDLIGGLFRQMNDPMPARGGRYKGVPYFNGGLYSVVDPIELKAGEVRLLAEAVKEDWSKVEPPIFGTLFENSMGKAERHAYGAHFTSEADIYKVVNPTISRPWQERIAAADKLRELLALRDELLNFKVLDPACGSGNFLYIAYRELKRVEMDLLEKIHANFKRAETKVGTTSLVSLRQFYGIDSNPFAVELAKVTLMLAKELALSESRTVIDTLQSDLPLQIDTALPLDNLDSNIRCEDALFAAWPKAQAIIGNPPYQSKNKMQQEYGVAYLNKVRAKYSEIPGRADYCVYWFRRTHDELQGNARAGLVGTKTIRENYSREGGLDYIVKNGGTITEAISTQVWSGDANVNVSIVNWIKGEQSGKKKLYTQVGDKSDSPWEVVELDRINAALSAEFDVTAARVLQTNRQSGTCYQGQTHGHEGFLLSKSEASNLIRQSKSNADIIFPYLTADELIANKPPLPERYVIDFQPRDLISASGYAAPFKRVKELVLPTREAAAREESQRNEEALKANPKANVNRHHHNFLQRWWLLSYGRAELIQKLTTLPRYIVCGQVTKRPIFEFIHPAIRPNAALVVFTMADDYSFGILQSGIHWAWFTAKCSKLVGRFRYTSDTVYDTFPWPQQPTPAQIKQVATAAVDLRALRHKLMGEKNLSFRELYRTLELPGKNPLKDAQEKLDNAVRAAYGMPHKADALKFLLDLNFELADKEAAGETITGPGLPPVVTSPKTFVTTDCVQM